jgi:hypothetical protein
MFISGGAEEERGIACEVTCPNTVEGRRGAMSSSADLGDGES